MNKFEINIKEKTIEEIKNKVASFNWNKLLDNNDWSLGANKKVMQEICKYWISDYNWKKEENELNVYNHYKADIDDLNIHFLYEKGISDNAIPLIISHGWPGSFIEFKKIIGPLTNPKKYGLDSSMCFDVIVPSIPGFAFSNAPTLPYGPRKIANYYNKLMTEVLDYKYYFAQGGDWGGAISSWLGFDHSAYCKGIHINIMIMRDSKGVQSEEESIWLNNFKKEQVLQEGYRSLQATKPQTLAYSMVDNPVGVAAWILEKFHGWSDLKNDNLLDTYNINDLITNVMIYLVTNSFNTASWIYYGRREEGGRIMNTEGKRAEVPTACALLPKEFLSWPPKSYVDRLYNVVSWNRFNTGGHFAAMEEPKLLVKDIISFIKAIKN